MNQLEMFGGVRCFVFDVDGVFTDGRVLLTEDGKLLRQFHVRDLQALERALGRGYQVAIITRGRSEGVLRRFNELSISNVYSGIHDKLPVLLNLSRQQAFDLDRTLYMGDDLPDVEPMRHIGLPTCPADAVPEVRSVARYISHLRGGDGCVREVIEKVLRINGHWP